MKRRKFKLRKRAQLFLLCLSSILLFVAGIVAVIHFWPQSHPSRQENEHQSLAVENESDLFEEKELSNPIFPKPPEGVKLKLGLDNESLKTPHILVYDLDSNLKLFQRGMRERITLASTTKIFLALYAREHLKMNDFTKSLDISSVIGANSSLAYLEDWHRYQVQDLFYAMLIPSGNDAANILAESAVQAALGRSFDSAAEANVAYIEAINDWLDENGYSNTHIEDPAGFEFANRSNLKDLLQATLKFIEDPELMAIVSHPRISYRNKDGIYFDWKNTNELMEEDSNHYCPRVHGIKTGSFPRQLYNLITYYEYKQRRFLILFYTADKKEDYLEDFKHIDQQLMQAIDQDAS